jgi:hypothetical protein
VSNNADCHSPYTYRTSTDAFADLDPVTLHISGEITGLELELSEIPDMEEESDLHTPDALVLGNISIMEY